MCCIVLWNVVLVISVFRMNECVFIYRTYHIVSQGGLQFYLSEIGCQLVNEYKMSILSILHCGLKVSIISVGPELV